MEIKGQIAEMFFSSKRRKIAIILFLTAAFIIIVMLNCSAPVVYDSPQIMICDKCNYRQELHFAKKLNCPKCGQEMGYLWKCMICRYEFEYRPVKNKVTYNSEEEFRKAKIESCRCPNCNSVETFPVTARNMPEKIPAPAK